MNKEKAIVIIEDEIAKVEKVFKDHSEWKDLGEFGKALKIAIKALKQDYDLDKIRAEIEELNPVDYGSMFSYESHDGARDMKRDVLDILDKYNSESEDKE